MKVLIRRSAVAAAHEREEALAEAIDVGGVHALLYQYGALDLADALTARLGPQDACAVAQRLRRLVRRVSRGRLWRDYRTTLGPVDAARVGLVAAWYDRAGQAGCRVWAELQEPEPEPEQTAPAQPLARVEPATARATEPGNSAPDAAAPPRIMPDWLTAPDTSVWSA